MNNDFPEAVFDTNGTRYPLDRMLGHGGQGAVFAVRGRDLAVKLSSAHNLGAQEQVRQNIARIRRLPLEGMNVARPLRALAPPHAGYVMELMTDMIALHALARPPRDWVAGASRWYAETGSLHRRLRVLAKTSSLFRRLHERGLAYGDASHQNIFISQSPAGREVWLIDCDNIASGVSPRAVYTPGYAAPELFRGHLGADSLTDSWSLGTLIFEALCMIHPFDGDLVHDGDPEVEERALRGELPWIHEEKDRRNHSSRGIPPEVALTPSLRRLASDCFEGSRMERTRRPGAAAWAEKLNQAADQVVVCPSCSSGYYLTARVCPWCDAPRPSFALVSVYLRDTRRAHDSDTPLGLVCKARGKPASVERVVVQEATEATLFARHLQGSHGDVAEVVMTLEGGHLSITGTDACTRVLGDPRGGRQVPLAGRTERLDLRGGRPRLWLLPGDAKEVHRVAAFELISGDNS